MTVAAVKESHRSCSIIHRCRSSSGVCAWMTSSSLLSVSLLFSLTRESIKFILSITEITSALGEIFYSRVQFKISKIKVVSAIKLISPAIFKLEQLHKIKWIHRAPRYRVNMTERSGCPRELFIRYDAKSNALESVWNWQNCAGKTIVKYMKPGDLH